MNQNDFSSELPNDCTCDCCRKTLPLVWEVRRFGSLDWMGIGIAKCILCDWLKVASTGSNEFAHREAGKFAGKLMNMFHARVH